MDLKEATAEDIFYLREETKKHLPSSLTINGLLNVGYRYGVVNTEKTKLYIPRNRKSPLFIFAAYVVDIVDQNANCFWDIKNYTDEQITTFLSQIPNWSWLKKIFFEACSQTILDKLKLYILGPDGLAMGKCEISVAGEGWGYHPYEINKDPNRFSLEDYEIKRICPSKATYIHLNWKHNFTDSADTISRCLKVLPSVGVFRRKKVQDSIQGDESELVSWTMFKHQGEIGCTTTLPEYRRKGLGSGITKLLANKCLEEGFLPYVTVGDNDQESNRIHAKLSYRKDGRFGWHFYLPIDEKS